MNENINFLVFGDFQLKKYEICHAESIQKYGNVKSFIHQPITQKLSVLIPKNIFKKRKL